MNQAAGEGKPRILYAGHDISRKEMEDVAEGIAPAFGLEARRLAPAAAK